MMVPETFRSLAADLAANHVYLSGQSDHFTSSSEYLLNSPSSERTPPRIVIVVGAGASAAACGLPTGRDASLELIERMKEGLSEKLIKEEMHRITVEYRLEEDDFETVLFALSKFNQGKLLDELHSIFFRRHYPSLTYEVFAHLLKHRFVDAVINFNFDEILDQALDDEIGDRGYYRVLSDGDCPAEVSRWLDERGRFQLPLYIKPHGTASHKSSLRFTRSSYSLLPRDIRDVLGALVGQESTRVIVVGHAMQSVEFNDILFQYSKGRLELLFIDPKRPVLHGPEKDLFHEGYWPVTQDINLDETLCLLWKEVESQFRPLCKPRGIQRHELIASLFARSVEWKRSEGSNLPVLQEYLKQRVFVEIALAVAKAKGFVSVDQMARERPGQFSFIS